MNRSRARLLGSLYWQLRWRAPSVGAGPPPRSSHPAVISVTWSHVGPPLSDRRFICTGTPCRWGAVVRPEGEHRSGGNYTLTYPLRLWQIYGNRRYACCSASRYAPYGMYTGRSGERKQGYLSTCHLAVGMAGREPRDDVHAVVRRCEAWRRRDHRAVPGTIDCTVRDYHTGLRSSSQGDALPLRHVTVGDDRIGRTTCSRTGTATLLPSGTDAAPGSWWTLLFEKAGYKKVWLKSVAYKPGVDESDQASQTRSSTSASVQCHPADQPSAHAAQGHATSPARRARHANLHPQEWRAKFTLLAKLTDVAAL